MRVSVIGIVGVPAHYGGFESLVENLIEKKSDPCLHYTVFCSSKSYPEKLPEYKGASLRYVNWHANGPESILYDMISMVRALNSSDVLLILGVSGCLLLPFLRLFTRKRIIVNIDGLEHQRAKWNHWIRRFLKLSEALSVRYGDMIIADNKGIQDYVRQEYGKPSHLIAYGGDHALNHTNDDCSLLSALGVSPHEYALSICRIEPENNVHLILAAFAHSGMPLVFVGNWKSGHYGEALWGKYGSMPNIHLVDSIYDPQQLFVLRSNCRYYIHGHSAGGTNPSLVEAMFFGMPVLAYNVVYNRETTQEQALYFKDETELELLLSGNPARLASCGHAMREIARTHYTWPQIVAQYEALFSEKGSNKKRNSSKLVYNLISNRLFSNIDLCFSSS